MAFLSLLPLIGASLVWVPVAAYFLLTGAAWKTVVLIAYGVIVHGLVDNLLRPILVGKDARMPDYVVMITTLGSAAVFAASSSVRRLRRCLSLFGVCRSQRLRAQSEPKVLTKRFRVPRTSKVVSVSPLHCS